METRHSQRLRLRAEAASGESKGVSESARVAPIAVADHALPGASARGPAATRLRPAPRPIAGQPARPHDERESFVNAHLHSLYYDLNARTAYTSIKRLSSEAAHRFGIGESEVRDWLSAQETHTRFKTAPQKFPLNFYNIKNLDDVFEIDTNDVKKYSEFNDSFKYFICMIDCLSRFLWTFPLKSKEGGEVARVLDSHFSRQGARVCRLLQADKGTEYVNDDVQRVLHKHGIVFRTLENRGKAAMVERVNRTIKIPLFKHFHFTNTWRWLEALPKIVFNYNHTVHSATNMCPADVTRKDVFRLWSTNYLRHVEPRTTHRRRRRCVAPAGSIRVGDTVRVSLVKGKLEKGFTAGYSQQVYKVISRTPFTPLPTYSLSDLNGQPLKGNFYARELQRVKPPSEFRVEKVLRRRRRPGHGPEVLVRWQGYDQDFDTWEPEGALHDI